MKKLKYQILFTILFMTIGIAAVTTNLVTNGNTNIASNPDDFLVYFSDAKIDGVQDLSLVDSKTSLVFNKELSAVGQSIVITYDVTNASKNYDADVSITCTQSTEYLTINNSFDAQSNLSARSSRTGTLSLTLSKSYTGEDLTQEISCTINASAVERISQESATVPDAVVGYYPMLIARPEEDDMFWAEEYRTNTTKIIFEDTINIPADAVESWDISETHDGSVIAYAIENMDVFFTEELEPMVGGYDLVIQSNGNVYGNKNMYYWFGEFESVNSIDGIENLNTLSIINMSEMFYYTGYYSHEFTLDLGDKFNTINVTDMSCMFEGTGASSENFTLNLGDKFDTSNVTDMGSMFSRTGASSENFTLDLGDKFDTSNVTNMGSMFYSTGEKSLNFTLDLGENFDTSKVTRMSYMFYETGYSNPEFTLNLGDKFNTSNVTRMGSMFYYTGYSSTKFTLELGDKFDTSKVTDMNYMFAYTGYSSTKFALDLGDNFDTSNVTDMSSMFNKTGYSNVEFTLNLGDKFDTSNVTIFVWMFGETGYNSTKLNISITIRNPDANFYGGMFDGAATKPGSQIIVNYTSETEALVDEIIARKSPDSNVIKGVQVD